MQSGISQTRKQTIQIVENNLGVTFWVRFEASHTQQHHFIRLSRLIFRTELLSLMKNITLSSESELNQVRVLCADPRFGIPVGSWNNQLVRCKRLFRVCGTFAINLREGLIDTDIVYGLSETGLWISSFHANCSSNLSSSPEPSRDLVQNVLTRRTAEFLVDNDGRNDDGRNATRGSLEIIQSQIGVTLWGAQAYPCVYSIT